MKKEKCTYCSGRKTAKLEGENETLFVCFKCKKFFLPKEKKDLIVPEPPKEAKELPRPIFTCRHCKQQFGTENKLRRHIGIAHLETIKI